MAHIPNIPAHVENAIEIAPLHTSTPSAKTSEKKAMTREEKMRKYIFNFRHPVLKETTAIMDMDHDNQGPLLAMLIDQPERLDAFKHKIIGAKFNESPKFPDTIFINIGLISDDGNFEDLHTSLRIQCNDPRHESLLKEYLELVEQEKFNESQFPDSIYRDALATSIVRDCKLTMNCMAKKIHKYTF